MNLNRDDYPTLNAPTPDCAGAVLTPETLTRFRDWILSDEYRENYRKAAEERSRQMQAMNAELKRQYAASLGKSVGRLTKQDMANLNESLFQAWLNYKGVTEKEFWDWIG
jgi:hypothetical protein